MTPGANNVVLLMGGNEGDTRRLLAEARRLLAEMVGSVVAQSSLYETEPWGFESSQNFVNQAVVVTTGLDPMACLDAVQAIECTLGRPAHEAAYAPDGSRLYSSRPIDIDIIFYNSAAIANRRLDVPHPRMHLRRFVLEPVAEVDPGRLHPLFGKTVAELLADCPDSGRVTRCES